MSGVPPQSNEDLPDEVPYYLEKVQITEDNDRDYEYEEIPLDSDFLKEVEIEEDLELAIRTIREDKGDATAAKSAEITPRPSVVEKPEVVDDFVRNFLVKMGLNRTLDCFQSEWYELQQKGQLQVEDVSVVPELYTKHQSLDSELKLLRKEVEKYRGAALRAKEHYIRLRKERDYHRMHHKRVVQEKNRLITDIKRLKKHYSAYEPTLRQLREKYESAMKQKMLTQLERDRAVGQVAGLQHTLNSEQGQDDGFVPKELRHGFVMMTNKHDGRGPTQRTLAQAREKADVTDYKDVRNVNEKRHPQDSEFPPDQGVNPLLSNVKAPSGHLTRTGGFRLASTFQAHSHPVASIALHPKKQILATASDDHTWKMWSIPGGDIIMTGEGHTDWVSTCDFHPTGSKLATGSGDTTVKIWDFGRAECVHTFADHNHAVWCVSWHHTGNFLASSSMDNSAKVFDLNSLRSRFTLRGHTDSVNSVQFLYNANTLLTASADKTISLWDARTGHCAQTFYGHMHAINHAVFNLRADTVASCDAYGNVKLWDVRTVSPMTSVDVGPHPANKIAFDPSGTVLAIASNDSTVKMYEIANGKVTSLTGHEDAVQSLVFDYSGDFLVSGGSDNTVRTWS